ncbi:hypothetical protein GCM10010220_61590 [Streptomyces parvulus]|nr:hypothetical protein GCM10010220_61590 [Streptomyces parvulus]
MGETDPFVCLLCLPEDRRPSGVSEERVFRASSRRPPGRPGATLGSDSTAAGSGWRIPT